jgi:hypothetical protein
VLYSRTKTILKILLNQQIVGRRILIKSKCVDDFTKFETKNVGSPKHDTAVNTNSRNNKGGVKPPCLTVVPTNENKTGITDKYFQNCLCSFQILYCTGMCVVR